MKSHRKLDENKIIRGTVQNTTIKQRVDRFARIELKQINI